MKLDKTSNVYMQQHPGRNFRQYGNQTAPGGNNAHGGPVIRQGRMQFSSTDFGFDYQRPILDSYIVSPYERYRRN